MLENLIYDSSSEDEEIPNRRRQRRRKIFRPRINFSFESNAEFLERFRMPPEKMELLLEAVGYRLQHNSGRSGALTAKQQLCIALHWFGSGSQYHTISDMHGVNKATVCRAIKAVVYAVNEILFDRVISWPENIPEEMEKFYRIAHFPQVCGVIDGSLIPIDRPTEHEAAFVDRWGEHSINCMFVCGASKKFYYVSANWPGSVHDARVLRNSSLYRRMEEQNIFPNAVILGDSAYPLKTWLMTPLHHDPENLAEMVYNRRHKGTRQVIEGALGILKEKFPCLYHLRVQPTYAARIVKCCTILCNFSRNDDDENIEEQENILDNQIEDEDAVMVLENFNENPAPAAQLRQQQILNLMNG